jgi:hypothetical protein
VGSGFGLGAVEKNPFFARTGNRTPAIQPGVFENKLLKKIPGPEKEEGKGKMVKLILSFFLTEHHSTEASWGGGMAPHTL